MVGDMIIEPKNTEASLRVDIGCISSRVPCHASSVRPSDPLRTAVGLNPFFRQNSFYPFSNSQIGARTSSLGLYRGGGTFKFYVHL